jgi:hypothetical protein
MARRRPSISPNVGIFVGISTFHIGLSFWKISNFNKVAAPAPATECVSMGYFRGCGKMPSTSVCWARLHRSPRSKNGARQTPVGQFEPPENFQFPKFFPLQETVIPVFP